MKQRRVGFGGFGSRGLAGLLARGLAGLLATGLAGCIDEGGPTLASLSVSVGQPGSTIDFFGTRLCGALDDCSAATGSATFMDVTAHAAPILSVTPTTLRVVVPPMSLGIKRVVAIVDGESSNTLDFEVVP